jgi:hypothetical protein
MRLRSLIFAFWLCAAAAHAQTAPPANDTPAALARVYACADIAEERERLACYDSAVGRLKEAETQGEFAAIDREQAREVERESFGFRLPSLGRLLPRFGGGERPAATASSVAEPEAEQQFVVERVIERRDGQHTFVMTDGQVWVQVAPQRAANVRDGTRVTIRRGALGGYMLVSERGGAGHRVRRQD